MNKLASPAFAEHSSSYKAWTMPTIRAHDGLVINSGDEALGDELLRIPEFQEELEQLREAARSEGYSLGKDQGYRQGLNQGKTEIQLIGDRLNGLFDSLMTPVNEQDQALENAILNLVVGIARQVVSEEAVSAPEMLRETIQTALRALPRGAGNIQIFLNPDDKKLLAAVGNLQEGQDIQVDSKLNRGGCRVETHESIVEYGLDYRFRQAVAQQIKTQYSEQQLATLSEPVELTDQPPSE